MKVKRKPDETRGALLAAAFEEIHAQGFRAASIDNILARTGVTKGALYHHFPNKAALGQAVVNEVLFTRMQANWQQLNDPDTDPVTLLLGMIDDAIAHADRDTVALGCPLNNLVQEMAGLDEDFRQSLSKVQSAWRAALESALQRGQSRGQVRANLDCEQAAAFLVAAYEGCVGVGKCGAGTEVFTICLQGMADYLRSLRPASRVARLG